MHLLTKAGRRRALWAVALGILVLSSGCATTPAAPGDLILGNWQSSLAGFSVTSTYTATDVSINGHAGLSYVLAGDRLTIGDDETMVRVISFPSSGEMVQLDVLTGTTHHFTRQVSAD